MNAGSPAVVTAPARRIQRPIFVVGCCNSGTTILWRSLLAHPDISGPSAEGQDLEDLPLCMKHFLGKQTSRMFAHSRFHDAYRLTEMDYDPQLADQIDVVYAAHSVPGKRFLEKSPANSLRTRFLQSIYPDAAFVIIFRNGFAVSEGIRRKRLFDPERPHLAGLPTTIAEAAEQWKNTNRILLDDRPHLTHHMALRYEDLVTKPAPTIGAVLRFCGCDPAKCAIPQFHRDLNNQQIARLFPFEKDVIESVASDMLHALEY